MTITLNGTTGITDVNGTAAAPAITGTDTDSGVYFGTNTVGLATNGANAFTADATTDIFYTGGTERARIDSSGNLLVGTTTTPNTGFLCRYNSIGVQVSNPADSSKWRQMAFANNSADAVLYFPNGTNTPTLSSAGAWTNASDGRQKTNITAIKYGLAAVLSSQPHSYNRTDVEGDYFGFVAQELKTVIPEVVFGSEETSYSVDYGSLVAVAFKAIQEQQALITQLTDRIAALEAR